MAVVLVVMVLFTGYRRHEHLGEVFANENGAHKQVVSALSRVQFPRGSQIVLSVS